MTDAARVRLADLLETIDGSKASFELAYQSKIAIERIRFAIRQLEAHRREGPVREACLQLLDALDRLQSAEARFQKSQGHSHSRSQG